MYNTPLERADKETQKGLKGFQKAHARLSKAQELYEQHRQEQAAAAEEWKRQVEAQIAAAEAAQAAAQAAHDKNKKKLVLLGDLIA